MSCRKQGSVANASCDDSPSSLHQTLVLSLRQNAARRRESSSHQIVTVVNQQLSDLSILAETPTTPTYEMDCVQDSLLASMEDSDRSPIYDYDGDMSSDDGDYSIADSLSAGYLRKKGLPRRRLSLITVVCNNNSSSNYDDMAMRLNDDDDEDDDDRGSNLQQLLNEFNSMQNSISNPQA